MQIGNVRSALLWLVPLLSASTAIAADSERPVVVVAVGAEGTAEYGKQFHEWAGRWEAAAMRGQAAFVSIGLEPAGQVEDRERLKDELSKVPAKGAEPVWLVLIGHGTYDGKTAKFNLRGPDVTPVDLAEWLRPIERPLAVVNCASSSGPFLNELSGPDRVVITATRSGHEYNFARFGEHLSKAIADPAADLDKDEQTSLLEAWLKASAGVKEFYASEARLETEHALLDDNGDRLGTPSDWFQGLRVTKTAKPGVATDGRLAARLCLVRSPREEKLSPAARARRDELEQALASLREKKGEMSEEEYLSKIEPLLVRLAKLYEGDSNGESGF